MLNFIHGVQVDDICPTQRRACPGPGTSPHTPQRTIQFEMAQTWQNQIIVNFSQEERKRNKSGLLSLFHCQIIRQRVLEITG